MAELLKSSSENLRSVVLDALWTIVQCFVATNAAAQFADPLINLIHVKILLVCQVLVCFCDLPA